MRRRVWLQCVLSARRAEDAIIIQILQCATSRLEMGHILPKQKNTPPNVSYVVQCMINYQKIDRELKKYWGILTDFCLGPKLWNGHRDPYFELKSKIHVFASSFSSAVLILLPNWNCAWKSLCLGLAILRSQLSYVYKIKFLQNQLV